LVDSERIEEKMGGILAIRELIACPSATPDTKTAKFSQVLSIALSSNSNFELLENIAEAIGYISKCTPVPLVDFIEKELSRSLEWLQDGLSYRRLAACVTLQHLANTAPTLFFVQCKEFFDLIWSPLRDPKERIRLSAARALSACLHDLDKRTYHLQWYCSIYEEVLLGFKVGTVESVHGSVLATEELLKYTGDFMLPRYKEVRSRVIVNRVIVREGGREVLLVAVVVVDVFLCFVCLFRMYVFVPFMLADSYVYKYVY
jgi:serine/threonine-protein kinase mTOR